MGAKQGRIDTAKLELFWTYSCANFWQKSSTCTLPFGSLILLYSSSNSAALTSHGVIWFSASAKCCFDTTETPPVAFKNCARSASRRLLKSTLGVQPRCDDENIDVGSVAALPAALRDDV